MLPPAQRIWAEDHLRSIAERTGVFGIVLTTEGPPDPSTADQIIEDVSRLGGEAAIALCTRDACDLSVPSAVSPGLEDAAEGIAPAPDPAPGQGLPPNDRGLGAWIEYVGALANMTD